VGLKGRWDREGKKREEEREFRFSDFSHLESTKPNQKNASGAGRFGSLAALFWALQLGSGVARGEPALVADSALAAAVTGSVFGLGALPRGSPVAARLRSSLLGAALGAGVAVPAAAAQKVLLGFLPDKGGKNGRENGGEEQEKGGMKWERTEAAASPFSPKSHSSSPSSSSSSAKTILAVAQHLESSMKSKGK